MQTETIAYRSGAFEATGFAAWDPAQGERRRPAVLIFPDAFGLKEHSRDVARELAAAGYFAFAADMYGKGQTFEGMDQVRPTLAALRSDQAAWHLRATAALQALASHRMADAGRVVAIGYCFGATTCLELARTGARLAGIGLFHGTLKPGSAEENQRMRACKVLVQTGIDDPSAPPDAVKAFALEMKAAGIDWQLNWYGDTMHSFTDPASDTWNTPGLGYNAQSDRRSWAALQSFLGEVLMSPTRALI